MQMTSMLKRPSLLGLCLLLSCKLALASPVFPLPALTAAPPQAATSAPPAAAAPANPPAIPPPGTPPPPPAPKPAPTPHGPKYSYVDFTTFQAQPYGPEDIGHGQQLTVSYALSDRAFVVGDFTRTHHSTFVTRRYDFGIGVNTAGTWGHNFFLELLWNGASTDPVAAPGESAHGYAIATGVRAVPVQDVELYAFIRHDQNDAIPSHTAGEMGVLYDLNRTITLGFSLGADAVENEYLLSLRWYY
jgi:hypothetical protein